jgi:carbonic anhydrase
MNAGEDPLDLIYRYNAFSAMAPRKIDDGPAAIGELVAGNRRFQRVIEHVRGMFRGSADEALVVPLDPMTLGVAMVDGTPMVQEPFGVVLGCSDARVPPEAIFGQDCNDLFVVRVAGNVLGIECLGSIDYAVGNMKSIKVLLVLGHIGCGAVTAAVSMYLAPTNYPDMKLSHSLRTIIDRIMFAVRGAAKALERVGGPRIVEDAGYRAALLEVAIYLNTALTAFDLVRRLDRDSHDHVQVVYGVFDIAALTVRTLPPAPGAPPPEGPAFATPPERVDDFDAIAWEIALAVIQRGVIDSAFVSQR